MEELTTFSTLLTQLINENGESTRKVAINMQERLSKENSPVKMSYPALASYKNFTSVPSFERAVLIMNYFNYPITNEELTEILDYSRIELKKMKLDDIKDIRQGIRLNPKAFSNDLSAAELEILIKQRISELYEDENASMNTYITGLIKNDLILSGYID